MIPSAADGDDAGAQILRATREVLARRPGALPVVTVSWAQSLAGAIAAIGGAPLAISGPESMTLTHRLRAAHDAILVGIATVLSDDPQLSVRLLPGRQPQPQPVVVDTHLRLPATARLLSRTDRSPWIFCCEEPAQAASALRERGARIFRVDRGPGGVDLYGLLRVLRGERIESVMVEGGARVLRAFITAGFADQAVVTVSPSRVEGLPGPGIPGFVRSVSEKVGADTVTWGELNP